MAWRIVQQPNGLFARFSDIVDDFTDYDMSVGDVIYLCEREYNLDYKASADKLLKAIGSPERWDKAFEHIRLFHGDEFAQRKLREIQGGEGYNPFNPLRQKEKYYGRISEN